jgi:hypothetical protein
MSPTDRSTVDDIVTATQRHHLFEAMIGADPETNKPLWLALDGLLIAAADEREFAGDDEVAELARHFPGLETAMLLIWHEHIKRAQFPGPCGHCAPQSVDGSTTA